MAIFTRQKVFFEQKVVFSFNFYHKKVPKKHSGELKIRNKNLMICPNPDLTHQWYCGKKATIATPGPALGLPGGQG